MAMARSANGSRTAKAAGLTAGPSGERPNTTIIHRSVAPIGIHLLGTFRLLKHGRSFSLRAGGKAQMLLANLALRTRSGIERDELLALVWPASDVSLAAQSLNSLVYGLRRSLGDALAGGPPVVHSGGRYRLNLEGGVSVDIDEFDEQVAIGDRLARAGDTSAAVRSYESAVELYGGDLAIASEVRQVLERERLRARYLSLLARLAEHHFAAGDYEAALETSLALLAHDPCREDAHRIVMRCHVRRGERAQALRQYSVCRQILEMEFGARPEGPTEDLYNLIRVRPDQI